MEGQHFGEQLRHDSRGVGQAGAVVGQLPVAPLQGRLGRLPRRRAEIAQARHVRRDGAVAKRHHQPAPGPQRARQIEVVGVGHRALHQAHIHPLREPLHIAGHRRIHHLHPLGQLEQPLVEVEERHVAARTARQPDGGQPQTGGGCHGVNHSCWSRARRSCWARPASGCFSPVVSSLWNRAPVGHTSTHLPQEVQASTSPQG